MSEWVASNQAVAFKKRADSKDVEKVIGPASLGVSEKYVGKCPNTLPKMNLRNDQFDGFGYLGSVVSPADYANWLNLFRYDIQNNFEGISIYPKNQENLKKFDDGLFFTDADLLKNDDGKLIYHPKPPNAQEMYNILYINGVSADADKNLGNPIASVFQTGPSQYTPYPSTNNGGYSPIDISINNVNGSMSPPYQHMSYEAVQGTIDDQKRILGGSSAKLLNDQSVYDQVGVKDGNRQLEMILPKMSNYIDTLNLGEAKE